jgi:protein-disulfide isomerase
MMNTTIRTLALITLAAGCSAGAVKKPVTAPAIASTTTNTTATTPALTPQELSGLETTPGSTPPLTHAVEPPSAPVAGLGGTPGASPAYGPENAPVRIYIFTDFQCPVCSRAVEPIKHVARAYPDDVRIIVKENALAIHSRAPRLAAASLAAFRQGKFWEFYDRLFANPRKHDDQDLVAHAQALGLDVARFQRDMDDESVTEQVKYESDLAASIDLAPTPGLVFNGARQVGWGNYSDIDNHVKRELERARKIAEGGVPPSRVAYEATRQSGPKGEQLAAALFAASK